MDGRKNNKRRGRGYNSPNRGRGRGNGNGDASPASPSPGAATSSEEPVAPVSSSPLVSSSSSTTTSREPVKDSSSSRPSLPTASPAKPKEDISQTPKSDTTTTQNPKEVVVSVPKSTTGGNPETVGSKTSSVSATPTATTTTPSSKPAQEQVKELVVNPKPVATTTTAVAPVPKKEETTNKEQTPRKTSSSAAAPVEKPVKDSELGTPKTVTNVPPIPDMSSSTPVKQGDDSVFETPSSGEKKPESLNKSSKDNESFNTPRSSFTSEDVPTTAESTPANSVTSTPQKRKVANETVKVPLAGSSVPKPNTPTPEPRRERPPTPPKPSKHQDSVTPASTEKVAFEQKETSKKASFSESGKFADKSITEASHDPNKDEITVSARRGSVGGKLGYMGSFGAGSNISTVGNVHGLTDKEEALAQRSTGSQAPSLLGFTRRQVLTLLVFSFANFFSAVIISLQAPFYPQEAEAKGATATEYGLVFGVFELVVFITSPIYGKYLHRVGPKKVFNIGIATTGIMTIAFGFLDRFSDRTLFISLSFVVRIIEAMGDAAFITASFAIIATEFPDSVATTFASLETFFGLGLIVGPTLGGALYQTGGFTLPFAVMGGLLLVVGFLAFFVMPQPKEFIDDGKKVPGGIISILRVPGVALAAFGITAASISVGFLNSTLEPHIRQFALTPVLTGLIFVINGGVYAVTAPGWGQVCDRLTQPRHIGLIGALSILIGFLFIGPAPFIPLDTVLWLTCLGLVIHGVGLGATLVSSFILALRESIAHGFADNIHTYGLTSGLWTSSFAFGAFVGPSVGGILLDQVGFRWATVFVLGVQLVLTILISAFIARQRTAAKGFKEGNLESAPLLKSVSEDPCSSKTAMEKNGQEGYQKQGSGYGAV